MSALSKYFNKKVNQCSPVQKDVKRVVNYDELGNEFITYPEVDYAAFTASLGTVQDWSLDALLKAGISPDFPIHTGLNTRLEGIDVISQASAIADEILAEGTQE